MASDPNQSGATFLHYLQKMCALCVERGEYQVLVEFIKNIPSIKPAKEITWSCEKCNNTFVTPRGHSRHKCTKPIPCLLCNKKFKLINDHYSKIHKIDYDSWNQKLAGNRSNSTSCLECKTDFNTNESLYKHLTEHHKIDIKVLLKTQNRGFIAANVQECESLPTAPERESMGNNLAVQEERDVIEDNPNAQKETAAPAAQEEVTENTNIQDEIERANAQQLCLQCNEYQPASSFESHTALHQRERETFEFMTSNSTRSPTSRRERNSSHSHADTVEKMKIRKQGGKYVVVSHSNHDAMDQSKTRNDTNQSEENLQGRDLQEAEGNRAAETNSGPDHANGSQDTRISEVYVHQNEIVRTNNELRGTPSVIVKIAIDLWKSRGKRSIQDHPNTTQHLNDTEEYAPQNKIRTNNELRRNAEVDKVAKDMRKPRDKLSVQGHANVTQDHNIPEKYGPRNKMRTNNELRRNADIDKVAQDVSKLQGKRSRQDHTNKTQGHNDNEEYEPRNKIRTNNELRRNADFVEIEEDDRKSCAKILWSKYYEKMKHEKDKTVKRKLYNTFLSLYRPWAPKRAVCHIRLSQAEVDAVEDVDAVDAESSTHQPGDMLNKRPFMFIKIEKYD